MCVCDVFLFHLSLAAPTFFIFFSVIINTAHVIYCWVCLVWLVYVICAPPCSGNTQVHISDDRWLNTSVLQYIVYNKHHFNTKHDAVCVTAVFVILCILLVQSPIRDLGTLWTLAARTY